MKKRSRLWKPPTKRKKVPRTVGSWTTRIVAGALAASLLALGVSVYLVATLPNPQAIVDPHEAELQYLIALVQILRGSIDVSNRFLMTVQDYENGSIAGSEADAQLASEHRGMMALAGETQSLPAACSAYEGAQSDVHEGLTRLADAINLTIGYAGDPVRLEDAYATMRAANEIVSRAADGLISLQDTFPNCD